MKKQKTPQNSEKPKDWVDQVMEAMSSPDFPQQWEDARKSRDSEKKVALLEKVSVPRDPADKRVMVTCLDEDGKPFFAYDFGNGWSPRPGVPFTGADAAAFVELKDEVRAAKLIKEARIAASTFPTESKTWNSVTFYIIAAVIISFILKIIFTANN